MSRTGGWTTQKRRRGASALLALALMSTLTACGTTSVQEPEVGITALSQVADLDYDVPDAQYPFVYVSELDGTTWTFRADGTGVTTMNSWRAACGVRALDPSGEFVWGAAWANSSVVFMPDTGRMSSVSLHIDESGKPGNLLTLDACAYDELEPVYYVLESYGE